MDFPLSISVVVPVYNVISYLEECVTSLLNQTHPIDEILLVDDGSTDGSDDLCDRLAKDNPTIKVIHQENRGLSEARNVGLEAASSNLIAFIDSDDSIAKTFVERMLQEFERDKEIDIVVCGIQRFMGNSDVYSIDKDEVISGKEALFRLCSPYQSLYFEIACNKIYRRSLFDGVRFPAQRQQEDTATTYKVIDKARKIAALSEPLYYYRVRPNSITTDDFSPKRLEALISLAERDAYFEHGTGDPKLIAAHRSFMLNAIGILHGECPDRSMRKVLRDEYLRLYEDSLKLDEFSPSPILLLRRYAPQLFVMRKTLLRKLRRA